MKIAAPISPTLICKIIVQVLGIIVMGVGLYSHFQSAWRKLNFYAVCVDGNLTTCPPLSLEEYYVAVVIITFMISLAILVASFLLNLETPLWLKIQIGYYAASGVLLLIGAICYIVSQVRISTLNILKDAPQYKGQKLLGGEKLAAAILTLFLSGVYGMTALVHAAKWRSPGSSGILNRPVTAAPVVNHNPDGGPETVFQSQEMQSNPNIVVVRTEGYPPPPLYTP